MSFSRKVRRKRDRVTNGRRTCPKCHAKLTEKHGYGLVCAECGWWKDANKIKKEVLTDDTKT